MIETLRLQLIRWEDAHFQAIIEKNLVKLGELLNVETPKAWTTFDDMEDALPFFYNSFKENGNYWGSFFTIHKADKRLLGTCGFKGAPNEENIIEIGYEIEASYRLKGLASEAAKGLIDFAFSHENVTAVMAHTLAHENPSVSILKKLGFQFVKELHDPDDGDIWQWLLKK
jgi:RimJ/RimL family protein N-acetyltransferase